MFGLDDLALAGLIATVAGTGMQMMQAQQNARNVRRASEEAARRQLEYSNQAGQVAAQRAQEMNTEARQNDQAQIADEMYQDFIAPVTASLTESADRVATQGVVSDDYTKARDAANKATLADAESLSNLYAKQLSAGRLRQNEAFKNADTASQIGLLQNFAAGDQKVGEMKMQEAANNVGALGTLGSLATGLGTIGMTMGDFSGLFSKTPTAASGTAKTLSTGVSTPIKNTSLYGQTSRAMKGLF